MRSCTCMHPPHRRPNILLRHKLLCPICIPTTISNQAFLEAFQAAPKNKAVAFLYVMNEVAQVRKQFRKAFEMQMKAILTTAMRKDNKSSRTILRLVAIWRTRTVFRPEVLTAATGLAQGGRGRTSTSKSSSGRISNRKSSPQVIYQHP